jgi:nitric oxide reductase subunit B
MIPRHFLLSALVALVLGAAMGIVAGFEFIMPGHWAPLGFEKVRPLHVSLVVAWIFLSALGTVYHHLGTGRSQTGPESRWPRIHLFIFIGTGLLILSSYIMGRFGGREYWEYPPWLSVPIAIGWVGFIVHYFARSVSLPGKWSVHQWMWATGAVFFLLTFAEAHMWLLPQVGSHPVREITFQWKAYGALVGSWNMLVYGTSLVTMAQISGDGSYLRSRMAFAMFLLGFTNLLMGWAHHVYPVPTAPWVRIMAYGVSMTELLILVRIIHGWHGNMQRIGALGDSVPVLLLRSAEYWILANLVLAIVISIPAINLYTHGTHITVAHAMGSTIGINTCIMLASVFHIGQGNGQRPATGMARLGLVIFNVSLSVFLVSLVVAGAVKSYLTMGGQDLPFQYIMGHVNRPLAAFAVAGIGVTTGLGLMAWAALRTIMGR